MVFLLEDASSFQEASVIYVSEQLAYCFEADSKRLRSNLPDLIEQGMDKEERQLVRRRWERKESIRLTARVTTTPSEKTMHIHLTPVQRDANHVQWIGECGESSATSPAGEDNELTGMLYRQLFDSLPNAAVLLDSKSNQIMQANQGFEQCFGYTQGETKGADIDELIVPEDGEPIPIEELYHKTDHSASTMEARRETKSGKIKDVLLTAAPVVHDGDVQYTFVIYLDVTENKKLQEQIKEEKDFFEAVIEGLPDTFHMFDKEGYAVLWNEYLRQVTGYTDEEIKELPIPDFVVERDRGQVKEAIEHTYKEGFVTLESKLLTKEGKEIPYHFSARRLKREDKDYIIVFGTNISAIKKVERQLVEANNDKKVLLEEIHHRVKNNLSHISSILQLQSYSTDSEEIRSVLQDSQARIQSIAMIHDQLYQHDSFKEVKMDHYVDNLAQTIEKTWASEEKEISYHIEGDPIVLSAKEAVTCGSLINELITNATKHAFVGREKGNIWIELKQINGRVQILVADDGVGLPDDFSLEADESLGVSLIRNFAQQLDADLSYSSGDGAEFKISFDLQ